MANHGPWCDCAACEADRAPVCTCQRFPTHCANDCPLHGLEGDEGDQEHEPAFGTRPADAGAGTGLRWAISMPSERDRTLGQNDMRVELRGATSDEIKAAFADLLVKVGWGE